MDCRATGTPTPTIEWYYGTQSNPLITSSKHTLGQDGSLTILSIESNDFAIYKCVAKNFLNSISADVQLKKACKYDIVIIIIIYNIYIVPLDPKLLLALYKTTIHIETK